MNRTVKSRFLAHKCYVTIALNRGLCGLYANLQPRWCFLPAEKCVALKKLRSSKTMSASANLWTQVMDNVSKYPFLANQLSPVCQISMDKRHLSTTSTSLSTLDEMMKPPEIENFAKPPEATVIRRINLDPAEKKAHVEEHLESLLDVYTNSGLVEEAQEILLFHHILGRSEQSAPILDKVSLYNTVLQGWSRKGDWAQLTELLDLMARDGPKANLQSYATALECAVRAGGTEQVSRVCKLLTSVSESGLILENLNQECNFVADQRELVLQAVRSAIPDFQPHPHKRTGPTCQLTQDMKVIERTATSPTFMSGLAQTLKEDADMQARLELEGKLSMNSLGKGQDHWCDVLRKCETNWQESLTEEFRDRLVNFNKSSSMMGIRGLSLKPYLQALSCNDYVSLMLDEIFYLGTHGYLESPWELYKVLGIKAMYCYHQQNKHRNGILQKRQLLYEQYCHYYCDHDLRLQYTPHQYWEVLLAKYASGPDIDYPDKPWPVKIQIEIGLFLYKILKRTKLDLKLVKTDKPKKRHVLLFPKIFNHEDPSKPTDEFDVTGNLRKVYRHTFQEEVTVYANTLPMVSPPMPWTSYRTGGYLLLSAPFVRLSAIGCEEQEMRIRSKSDQQLSPLFEAVNFLSGCPWIINKQLLDIMVTVFKDGGNIELGIPPRSSAMLRFSEIEPDMSDEEVAATKSQNHIVRQQRSRLKRLWNKLFQALTIAVHYRDQTLWFPHTLDFRGRVYPFPTHLRHTEGDAIRSLLMFAEGKPLGPSGVDWLKLHLVNLTGLKKTASLAERLAYCNEMQSEIEDSAQRPLAGRRWWAQSKEPWQTLSTCIELANALRSGSPESYVCHLPVHQDGSSNGLQHYAALGRDKEGARLVNLRPQEFPQDIYMEVATAVEEKRLNDAADGLDIAKNLEGYIQRNVVKESVMTSVNGIVSKNSRMQIVRLLGESGFPSEHLAAAAEYINNNAYASTQAIFKVSSEIQKWMMDCAVQITRVSGRPVEWETPLGFPIVQPYLIPEKKWDDCDTDSKDNPQSIVLKKQRRAFPPNYIQSLESTHLMLTALFCQREGLTFAAVHDSYWTHPSTVDAMNKICRQQFVKMHSMPLLETLSEFLDKTYCKSIDRNNPGSKDSLKEVLHAVPEKGDFDLQEILSSTYFFS